MLYLILSFTITISLFEPSPCPATIARTSRLGWNIKFDYKNKKFVFESLVGIDRTVNQADVPPMIFSRRYDNVLELEYTKDVSEYKNCAIVAGQGEGSKIKEVKSSTSPINSKSLLKNLMIILVSI